MDSTYAPQPRDSRVPVGLRAPFSGRTWREFLYLLLGLPLSVVMFGYAVAVISLGAGLLITFLGFPLLAGGLAGCRALGGVERGLARALLGVRIAGPGPVRATRPGATGWMTAVLRSGASWRHLLHTLLRFPWALFAFVVSVTLWATGWAMLAYPLWRWTFVEYLGRPGIQVWGDSQGNGRYLETPWEVAAISAVGLVLVLVTPWVIHGLTQVDRAMARGLLSASRRDG
ncbi:sensor domain-containing protein [Streptomyces sp. NPDC048248]|uniref:sensor domain-containing protein n=1 Tax=Streptomyces sp. NPDC048248 TaxID=3365523 RepID=UPI00371FC111